MARFKYYNLSPNFKTTTNIIFICTFKPKMDYFMFSLSRGSNKNYFFIKLHEAFNFFFGSYEHIKLC